MSPRIQTVDYERMPQQANEMREEAKVLNKEMTLAYKSIDDMRKCWYGKRYNELVEVFNQMQPSLNKMLALVVTAIPSTLETIANNYSQVDRGQNIAAVNDETPNKIENIAESNEIGMRFLTAEVNEVKQKVSTNFTNAKELMDSIENIYSKVVWESEASESFKATFTSLKNEIVTSFENTNAQFKKLMEQAEQDIAKAEKANTVN